MATGLLDEIKETVDRVRAKIGPSVVGIGNRWGAGSGIVIGDGLVLTNAHNIRGDRTTVTFDDGRETAATLAGADVDGDLAVLRVDTGTAPAVAWADDGIGLGSPVFALSNPGGRGLRVTFGMVSGTERSFRGPRGRRIAGSVEHTAPLLPGSSGGPVTDRDGGVIGINTNRLGEGFYLAIPTDAALRGRVDALARGEAPARPRLGVAIAPSHVARGLRRAVGLPEIDGLLVRGVEEGGPAAHAGITDGDTIVAAGGKPVSDVDDLHDALASASGSLELRLVRGAEERTVTISL